MRKRARMFLALAIVLSLFAGFSAVALAASEKEDAKAAEEAKGTAIGDEEDLEGLDRIGEETEDCYKVKITNATGSDIMGLNIQKATDDAWTWSDELLTEEDLFEDEETALFCYAPDEEEAEAEDESQDEPALYNIQIVFSDWTVGYLHNVLLSGMEAAEIQRAANSLPYLVYTDPATDEQIDTYEMEQAVFEGQLADGFWDSVTGGGSGSSGSSGGGGYSGGGSSSGGANTDGCIGGDALFN